MKGATSRGFSLIEVLIAVAVFAILGYFLLRVTTGALHWVSIQAQRDSDAATVGTLADRWQAESDSAWAIFTPPNDVNGVSNADQHELDFFTRDGANRSYFWAYTYDAKAQTLTRYLYGTPGGAPVKDETYAGVTKFVAHTYPVTALQDSTTPVYSALYKNATLHSGAVRFYASAAPWVAGGNQVTYVRIETASEIREMKLVTQTAPSGFTVVLQYTPSPAPAPTHGPLRSLGRIVFSAQALAYDDPVQRLARGLNAVLGGATVSAQTASCSYAQLFLDNAGTITDANGEDGYNQTDSSGCVTDGNVLLWATEPSYMGYFFASAPSSGVSCSQYVRLSTFTWPNSGNSIVTPVSATPGCTEEVTSSDETTADNGQADVVAVVQSNCGSLCYALVTIQNQETLQGYHPTCCPPAETGNHLNYVFQTSQEAYSSADGGLTWSAIPGDICSATNRSADATGQTPPPQPSCSIPAMYSWNYQARELKTYSNVGQPAPPPSPNPYIRTTNTATWSPKAPMGTTGINF